MRERRTKLCYHMTNIVGEDGMSMKTTGTGLSRRRGEIPESANQTSLTAEAATGNRPYPPSWVDRLTDRVRRLPLPWWLVYLAVGVVLTFGYMILVLSSEVWRYGLIDLSAIVVYGVLNGMTLPYILALIHFLDNSAEEALARFRPVMTVDDAGYEKLRYQITTLPARSTLIA